MTIRNPQAWLRYSMVDHSNETSRIEVPTHGYNVAQFPNLLTRMGDFRNAIKGVSGGALRKEMLTNFETTYTEAKPTNPDVQRERKWLISYQSNNGEGYTGRVEIPCARVQDADGSLLLGDTEKANMTHPKWVTFKNEFEWIVRDRAGNTVEITSIVLVHRNT